MTNKACFVAYLRHKVGSNKSPLPLVTYNSRKLLVDHMLQCIAYNIYSIWYVYTFNIIIFKRTIERIFSN